MTKKELLQEERKKDKLEKTLGGIRDMHRLPQAVWIVDTKKEHLAVDEARKLHIPIVGILDTNCDPDEVDYAIPGNDDAIRSVALLTRIIADAAAEGLLQRSSGRGDRRLHRGRADGRVGARAPRAAEPWSPPPPRPRLSRAATSREPAESTRSRAGSPRPTPSLRRTPPRPTPSVPRLARVPDFPRFARVAGQPGVESE
jgi:hypothetical protein